MASEELDQTSSERVRELEDMVQKLKQENMKLLGTVKDGPRKFSRPQLDSPEDPEADLIPLGNTEDDPDEWLYVSPLHPPTPAHKALTPRQWLLEGFDQTKDEDIPSLDEVRKAISFQSTEVEAIPTAARPVRAKAPTDEVVRIKGTPSEGGGPQRTRSPRAKAPPDEEPIPVVRARIPLEDVVPPTEEAIPTVRAKMPYGEGSAYMATEEDVPAMPVRAKLPFDEDLARPIRAKLPPYEESITPEDVEEQLSNSSTEEAKLVITAKLPPQDGMEDVQQTSRPARARLPGAGSRPFRAKLPPDEESIPVVRAKLPPEDLDEQVTNTSTEEVIPIIRAKLPPGEDGIKDMEQTSRPARARVPGAGSRPLRAKLPPDEESIPVVRAKLRPEDMDEQVPSTSTEEAVPVVGEKLPPAEGDVMEDVQQISRPARAKLSGAGGRPLRAKLPPDEESLPLVRARLPPECVEEHVSVSPTEDCVTPVKAKLPEGRGTKQGKVVRSKLAAPSASQEDQVPRPRPGSAQSQTSVASPLSGLPKPARNISSPNLPQTGGSPGPRGPKQSATQSTKRVSTLTSQQSSPSPPPLQPSLSPSPTDGGQTSVEAEQVGPKAKVVAVSRLTASPSSNRNPSARGLANPSGQKLSLAKGDRAVPSSSSTSQAVASRRVLPSAEGGEVADSPSNLKVPSKSSPRSKIMASPSNQQKRLVSAPTSRVTQAAQPAANGADDWSEGCY
ncbi:hypothetical protein EMCRGX_G033831 [Ephydatia muelleri]